MAAKPLPVRGRHLSHPSHGMDGYSNAKGATLTSMRILGSIMVGLTLGIGLSVAACLYLDLAPAPASHGGDAIVTLLAARDVDAGDVTSLPFCFGFEPRDAGPPLTARHGRTGKKSTDCSVVAIRGSACPGYRCRIGNRAYEYAVVTPV
jgi:hypothetical protein